MIGSLQEIGYWGLIWKVVFWGGITIFILCSITIFIKGCQELVDLFKKK